MGRHPPWNQARPSAKAPRGQKESLVRKTHPARNCSSSHVRTLGSSVWCPIPLFRQCLCDSSLSRVEFGYLCQDRRRLRHRMLKSLVQIHVWKWQKKKKKSRFRLGVAYSKSAGFLLQHCWHHLPRGSVGLFPITKVYCTVFH